MLFRYLIQTLLVASTLLTVNCSPTLFTGGSSGGGGGGSEEEAPPVAENPEDEGDLDTPNPSEPGEPGEPTPEKPQILRCDVLIDKTGAYFNIGQQKTSYLAITGITECAFNELNGIQGPCDPDTKLTILKPDDVPNSSQDDLYLNPENEFSFLPDNGGAQFLCMSFSGQVLISTGQFKILLITKKN